MVYATKLPRLRRCKCVIEPLIVTYFHTEYSTQIITNTLLIKSTQKPPCAVQSVSIYLFTGLAPYMAANARLHVRIRVNIP
jgi:hypothetical protein